MRHQNATIIIVDISGYTQFVKSTDHVTGAQVIAELLDCVIRNNTLSLKISEIEGDAILFYKYGCSHQVASILSQFELWLTEFNQRIEHLKIVCPPAATLSLKMVAHFGAITEFKVARFEKLYGKPVVEAHRLLKNHVHSHTYALITQDYLTQLGTPIDYGLEGMHLCEVYDVGELCYTYFPYDAFLSEKELQCMLV